MRTMIISALVTGGSIVLLQLVCLALFAYVAWKVGKQRLRRGLKRLFTDNYPENLWEGVVGLRHVGVQRTIENELRSSSAAPLLKPIGSDRPFPHFDGLLFIPAPLPKAAKSSSVRVDLHTVLGRRTRRPMSISMPVMVTAMGYGVALSKAFSLAIAKGTAQVGTAFNTGQGPVLPEHRTFAHRMVVQYHGASWRPSEDALRQADMVEIRFGQGANAGCGTYVETAPLPSDVLADFGVNPDDPPQRLHIPPGIPGVSRTGDLKHLVDDLRRLSNGAPIALKMAAGHHLEQDIEMAVRAGVDVLVVDGAQGGTHGSPAILVDDFGLPTLTALCRAVRCLETLNARHQVDLVMSGGFRTPGDILKAVALGADAVYIGTIALFAVAHTQILKPLPFEPPTQIAWVNGKFAQDFDMAEGARTLADFLSSFAREMEMGIRAVGKSSVRDLDRSDLVSWDTEVARVTNLPLV